MTAKNKSSDKNKDVFEAPSYTDLLANFKNMSTSDQEELLVKLAQTYKTQSQGATAKE